MRNNAILIILSGLLLCCAGCITSSESNYIEDSIQDQIYSAKLNKDFKISLGSSSMRMINGLADDEEEASTEN